MFNRSDSFARWELIGPDGKVLHDFQASPVSTDTVDLPADGEYRITVNAGKPAAYNLTLSIPGAPSQGGSSAPGGSGDKRINFAAGTDAATVDGGITDAPRNYVFRASAGQQAQVDLGRPLPEGVEGQAWDVIAPDGTTLEQTDAGADKGKYELEQDGDYTLKSTCATTTPYKVTLTFQDVTSAESSDRISFAPGTDSATFDGGLAENSRSYVFEAAAGQTAQFDLPEGNGPGSANEGLSLLDPDGEPVQQDGTGEYPLAKDGSYSLTSTSAINEPYTITLTIPGA